MYSTFKIYVKVPKQFEHGIVITILHITLRSVWGYCLYPRLKNDNINKFLHSHLVARHIHVPVKVSARVTKLAPRLLYL